MESKYQRIQPLGLPLDVFNVIRLNVDIIDPGAPPVNDGSFGSDIYALYMFEIILTFPEEAQITQHLEHPLGSLFWQRHSFVKLPLSKKIAKRFSQFSTLYAHLVARYPSVPVIPAKTFGHRNLSRDFLMDRHHGLTLFLQALTRRRDLMCDVQVIQFLGCEDVGETVCKELNRLSSLGIVSNRLAHDRPILSLYEHENGLDVSIDICRESFTHTETQGKGLASLSRESLHSAETCSLDALQQMNIGSPRKPLLAAHPEEKVLSTPCSTSVFLSSDKGPFAPILIAELCGDHRQRGANDGGSPTFRISSCVWNPAHHTLFLGLSDESYLSSFDALLSHIRLPWEPTPPTIFRGRLFIWKTTPFSSDALWPKDASIVYVHEFMSEVTQLHLSSPYIFVALASGQTECFATSNDVITQQSSAQLGYLLPHHTASCTAIAYDAERHLLVTGSLDRSLKVFDFNSRSYVTETHCSESITVITFDHFTFPLLFVGSLTGTVFLYDFRDQSCLKCLASYSVDSGDQGFQNGLLARLLASSRTIMAGSPLNSSSCIFCIVAHEPEIFVKSDASLFSNTRPDGPNNSHLFFTVFAGLKGGILLSLDVVVSNDSIGPHYEFVENSSRIEITPEGSTLCSLACCPTTKWIAAGSSYGTVTVYDPKTRKILYGFKPHETSVRALQWHNTILLTGGSDCYIRWWKWKHYTVSSINPAVTLPPSVLPVERPTAIEKCPNELLPQGTFDLSEDRKDISDAPPGLSRRTSPDKKPTACVDVLASIDPLRGTLVDRVL